MSRPSTHDPEALWSNGRDQVLSAVTSPAQRQWLETTHPVGFTNDTIVLATPHDFARHWIESQLGDRIRQALSHAAARPLDVVITVQPQPEPEPVNGLHDVGAPAALDDPYGPPDGYVDHTERPDLSEVGRTHRPDPPSLRDERRSRMTARGLGREVDLDHPAGDHLDLHGGDRIDRIDLHEETGRPLEAPGRPPGPQVVMPEPRPLRRDDAEPDTKLQPKYSFENFVIGSSNRFAHAAAVAVAEAPAKSYNPLFIYGDAGLGKTHLLHAIGLYVRSLYPRLQVRYVTTEQFTNEFINAIRDDRITSFQRTYRQVDLLLIDDIQFLEQKERTQEEFFHTFNALHNAEKQIVISSDRPPKQIARLEDRLRSRFEWGLITDVQPPDLETRIAILRKKCESDRLGVPPDVLELIASRVQSNIRELEGALIRVSAFASFQHALPDAVMAETVLKDLFPDDREQEIGVQLIQDVVADFYSLTIEDLCSASRSRQLVMARQIAMYLTREMTLLSLPTIGKAFGGRDHTTVMHAKKKIEGLMQERRAVYDQVQELTNRIKTRARTS